MKDLNSLKKELKRLADVNVLKTELNRLASEIKRFDVHLHVTPQAKSRLVRLEKRFREVVRAVAVLQKDVDSSFAKFAKIVRSGQTSSRKSSGKTANGVTARKSARKTSTR